MQLKEIEKLAASVMERAVDAKEVAGVNLLVLKDKAPVLSLQAGYADLENKVLMADDTIMRLYSMSKPVTAACMMILMQRGLVDLNDPVSKFIPAFANQTYVNGNSLSLVQRPMTVHDLLFMTSGLSYGSDSAAGKATSDLFAEMDARLSTKDAMTTRECRQMLFLVPALWCLDKLFHLNGIWLAFPVAETATLLVALVMMAWHRRKNIS